MISVARFPWDERRPLLGYYALIVWKRLSLVSILFLPNRILRCFDTVDGRPGDLKTLIHSIRAANASIPDRFTSSTDVEVETMTIENAKMKNQTCQSGWDAIIQWMTVYLRSSHRECIMERMMEYDKSEVISYNSRILESLSNNNGIPIQKQICHEME